MAEWRTNLTPSPYQGKAWPPVRARNLRRKFAFKLVFAGFLGVLLALCGCATDPPKASSSRNFSFQADTFSFPNELVWEYYFDAKGKWTSARREPPPTYSHHCFVLARSTRQFFLNARFAPHEPAVGEETYRGLIRKVISSNPRYGLPEDQKVVIPGYADLRSFSTDWQKLLKQECGGAWESYFQRGHWRMIFRFSRAEQSAMSQQILSDLKTNEPVVVHIVRFPQLTINHAVVIYDATETTNEIRFTTYDPNHPVEPVTITYDKASRTFTLPANDYFFGGRIDVYEVYHRWNY